MEETKHTFKERIKNFFINMKKHFKDTFNKEYLSYSFQKYRAFTALQLKEVFSRDKAATTPTRDKVISIVTPVIKFVAVFGIAFALLFVNGIFQIFSPANLFNFFVFFTTIIFVLQLISSIASCTKSYYVSEDNKVLITFPSSGASLFLSKLTVEFVKEMFSGLLLYMPVCFAVIIFGVALNPFSPMQIGSIFWGILPMFLLFAIITLFASLFSVLYLQYLRLAKKFPVVRFIVVALIFGAAIYLTVLLISLIPENINIISTWNDLKNSIDQFLVGFASSSNPFTHFCNTICGFRGNAYKGHQLNGMVVVYFLVLLAIFLIAFILVFIVIKRIFLSMMSKSVDFEKVNENSHQKNVVHHKHTTFAFKELKISFRSIEISGSYIVTYVLIPVLIFLLCKIFDAINTSMKGNMLSIMFIILMILLPLLASNTPISSSYSREGHAGYIKKTKPIGAFTPMFSKLLFTLILSVPCILASIFIVGNFGKIDVPSLILLGFSILFVQYGHILFSSTLDFMKPKNESYQTEGQDAKNSNENTATIVAFVMSFLFAFFVFFFFNEQIGAESFASGAIRVFIIALLVFAANLVLYLLKLKAYFMER